MNRRLALVMALAALSLALAARWVQRPYTTSFLIPDGAQTRQAVDATGFWIGPHRVNIADYTTAPSLQEFRKAFQTECDPQATPFEQAVCISSQMAARFAHGEPAHEFVAPAFDPAIDLLSHLGGEPGHCVTRAGLAATVLLSRGVAARALQLITRDGIGHNVFEVWTSDHGWVIVDPTYGHVTYRPRDGAAYQIETATKTPEGIEKSFLDRPGALSGLFIYPEPWLHTRIGTHWAPWPFRGTFIVGGPQGSRFVVTHWGLFATALSSGGLSTALFAAWVLQRRAVAQRSRRDELANQVA